MNDVKQPFLFNFSRKMMKNRAQNELYYSSSNSKRVIFELELEWAFLIEPSLFELELHISVLTYLELGNFMVSQTWTFQSLTQLSSITAYKNLELCQTYLKMWEITERTLILFYYHGDYTSPINVFKSYTHVYAPINRTSCFGRFHTQTH